MQVTKNTNKSADSKMTIFLLVVGNLFPFFSVVLAALGAGVYLYGWFNHSSKFEQLGSKFLAPLGMLILGLLIIFSISSIVNILIWVYQFLKRAYLKIIP